MAFRNASSEDGEMTLRVDCVAKRFRAVERRIFFRDRAPMRNIDLRIRSFGFKSCPLLAYRQLVGDFCNTIGQQRPNEALDFESALT